MNHLLAAAVLMLMLSIGMSLRFRDLVVRWRSPTPAIWLRLLLALGCLGVSRGLLSSGTPVGPALLPSGQYLHNRKALPAIACYALAAPLVMGIYAKLAPRAETEPQPSP